MNLSLPQSPLNRSTALRFTFIWFVVSLSVFILMVLHQSEPSTILGRYSSRYTLTLAVMLIFSAIAAVLFTLIKIGKLPSISLPLPSTRGFAWFVIGLGMLLIGIVWLFVQPGSNHIPAIALFRAYLAGLVFGGMILILHASGMASLLVDSRWSMVLGLLTVAIALVLVVVFLGKVPGSLYFDEPAEISWSYTFLETRQFRIFMYPTDPLPPQAMATNSFLKMIVGFWMGLVGVGLEQARLFYLIPAAVGVVAVYLTTRHLYGSVAGLAALAIAAYIPLVHTYARADVFLPSMTAVGLYFLVTARSTGARWRHYLAGLTVCFSIEGHHYGVCMVAAFGLIYLFDYARQISLARRWQWSPAFWSFVLGCLTFVPFYLYVHFLIVPGGLANIGYLFPVYSTQVTLFSKESYPVRILNANWTLYRLFMEFAPLEALVGLLGVLSAFLRRNNEDRLMLSILGLFLLIWALLLAHGSFYYRIFYFPFVGIFGGALIAQLAGLLKERGSQNIRLNFAGIAGVSLISVLFISNTINTFLYRQSADEFTEMGRKLDRVLPPDITIAGAPPFYFGMPTRRGFVSAETFDDKPPEAWGLPAPSVIILTRHVDEQKATIQNYLKQHNFAKRYCFSISLFGGESVVYQLPSIPIDNTLPKCNEN